MISINADNLTKSFGKTLAVDQLSFQVEQGELFGFIGPDGAGKTTLFRMLTTLLSPDRGNGSVEGLDITKDYRELRNILGYMPGKFSLYQDLTVEENLTFFATIFGTTIKENYNLVKDIYSQIEPFKDRRAGKLSGGMKQKLALCCALIHKPKVLFLDEPTTGVDPVSRKEFWEILKRLQDMGITIIVSTPYMDEAGLCDRVALIQGGKILKIDKPSELVSSIGKRILAISGEKNYQLLRKLEGFQHTENVYPFGESLHYIDVRREFDAHEIQNYLKGELTGDIQITEVSPTIEDCFISLMLEK